MLSRNPTSGCVLKRNESRVSKRYWNTYRVPHKSSEIGKYSSIPTTVYYVNTEWIRGVGLSQNSTDDSFTGGFHHSHGVILPTRRVVASSELGRRHPKGKSWPFPFWGALACCVVRKAPGWRLEDIVSRPCLSRILGLLTHYPTKMVDFLHVNWVVNTRSTGLGVFGNTYQVSGNVCKVWKMLHRQDISIYFCINISKAYMMLEKLSIVLRPCLLISKMRIAVLPRASAQIVSFSKNKIGLKSQDACVFSSSKNH